MTPCDAYGPEILRYLDNDLHGHELDEFLAHIETCEACGTNLVAEKALSDLFHRTRPLYTPPPTLRSLVRATLLEHGPFRKPRSLYESVLQILEATLTDAAQRVPRRRLLTSLGLVTGLFLMIAPKILHEARAANFVEIALTTHRSYLNGNVPLGIRSKSPDLVTAWLAQRVPFQFRLPNAQSVVDSIPAYELTGAGLVNDRGSAAALVTYQKPDEKISLLVEPSKSAVVCGGDEVRFGALSFHYRTDEHFRVITWSNHGLSYALVSSVSISARESCHVCHQSMKDHGDFKPQT
jgi:anti-sigma factor RsiW